MSSFTPFIPQARARGFLPVTSKVKGGGSGPTFVGIHASESHPSHCL
ncbi:MAG: hypothetical protein PHF18_17565 [Methanosarcina sp.]|nr:hypothetical protein [Methanosarcina sp.]MDD3248639.1 hypothetical protein [Methanosarcina sp.]MDD4249651.1 hypothetical protein [Methanosarcina sp.]